MKRENGNIDGEENCNFPYTLKKLGWKENLREKLIIVFFVASEKEVDGQEYDLLTFLEL